MKVEPITIVNVDQVPYAVNDMSDEVKRLVEFYNDWRQKEADLKGELLMVQAAERDLSREIVATIKQERDQHENGDQVTNVEASEEEPANAADGGDGD